MADQVVNVILKFGAAHLQLFNFLVGGKINFLFDAIDGIVEPMIFVEHFPEVVIGAFQAADDFTMLRKLSKYGMMKVHGNANLSFFFPSSSLRRSDTLTTALAVLQNSTLASVAVKDFFHFFALSKAQA